MQIRTVLPMSHVERDDQKHAAPRGIRPARAASKRIKQPAAVDFSETVSRVNLIDCPWQLSR